jgi:hypothetical protein
LERLQQKQRLDPVDGIQEARLGLVVGAAR